MTDIDTLIDRLSDRQRREFGLWCAERVRHLMTDERSTNALDVAARHLRGEASDEELAAAWDAAAAASWSATCNAAWAAAGAAAWDAARAASWAATWAAWAAAAASWAATCNAAWAAAGDAARAAAWDTERAAQRTELERMLKEVTP